MQTDHAAWGMQGGDPHKQGASSARIDFGTASVDV